MRRPSQGRPGHDDAEDREVTAHAHDVCIVLALLKDMDNPIVISTPIGNKDKTQVVHARRQTRIMCVLPRN
ncbi:hypothetical protein ASE07_22140 [Noviherbaspirillum sp. Root189]|nr:hypothetical protein ASE07_22140 [Noviherbaspirillum sp. Root189]